MFFGSHILFCLFLPPRSLLLYFLNYQVNNECMIFFYISQMRCFTFIKCPQSVMNMWYINLWLCFRPIIVFILNIQLTPPLSYVGGYRGGVFKPSVDNQFVCVYVMLIMSKRLQPTFIANISCENSKKYIFDVINLSIVKFKHVKRNNFPCHTDLCYNFMCI